LVWLTLQLSGNDEIAVSNDTMKVQDLYRYIHEKPGRDHYEILVANGEWQVRLTPEDNTMLFDASLRMKLEDLLGAEAIEAKVVG
ncbi:MAG TPA: hypothetical protein DHW02_23485, partial [Ktedonobacter sp.]|nr:hypothetical protein [Ktedonobacter sp.]